MLFSLKFIKICVTHGHMKLVPIEWQTFFFFFVFFISFFFISSNTHMCVRCACVYEYYLYWNPVLRQQLSVCLVCSRSVVFKSICKVTENYCISNTIRCDSNNNLTSTRKKKNINKWKWIWNGKDKQKEAKKSRDLAVCLRVHTWWSQNRFRPTLAKEKNPKRNGHRNTLAG